MSWLGAQGALSLTSWSLAAKPSRRREGQTTRLSPDVVATLPPASPPLRDTSEATLASACLPNNLSGTEGEIFEATGYPISEATQAPFCT